MVLSSPNNIYIIVVKCFYAIEQYLYAFRADCLKSDFLNIFNES